jgi:hypothetical protein
MLHPIVGSEFEEPVLSLPRSEVQAGNVEELLTRPVLVPLDRNGRPFER